MRKGRKKSVIAGLFASGLRQLRLNYAFLIIVFLVGFVGLYIVTQSQFQNAQLAGSEVAARLARDLENQGMKHQFALDNAARAIDAMKKENAAAARITQWLEEYLVYMKQSLDIADTDIYCYVDGQLLAGTYWEGDATYDAVSTQWYQNALENRGEVAYTDAYIDVVTGNLVVTLSRTIDDSDDVVAIDLYMVDKNRGSDLESLPEGSLWTIYDAKGTLLSYAGNHVDDQNMGEEYVSYLFEEAQQGAAADPESYVLDPQGRKQGIYSYTTDFGWVSVITIPYAKLLANARLMLFFFSGVLLLYLALAVAAFLLQRASEEKNKQYESVIQALSNMFYAMFLIDMDAGTFQIFRPAEDLLPKLQQSDRYEHLLEVIESVIHPDMEQSLAETFSLENIRKLVEEDSNGFGGDFRRRFGNHYEWVNIQLLFDKALSRGQAILAFKKINARKVSEIEKNRLLQESLEMAHRSMDSRNQFFSRISHDMRTPLNAIIGLSGLALREGDSQEKNTDYFRKINDSSKHLLLLINDLLDLSKLESGGYNFKEEPLNLEHQVQQCVELFQEQLHDQNKKLTVEIQLKDRTVCADAMRLDQVLNNLLSNAVKYTSPGDKVGVRLCQLSGNDQDKMVYQLTVWDTGKGMSEEFCRRIFVPYEREERFGAANVIGTGLGMPIVHTLVTQMGGQISVESKLGKGSTFVVTIPLRVSREQAGEREHEELSTLGQQEDFSGKRILLVEDNAINMEIAEELLKMHGLEVTRAWNGQEAVDAFENSPPGYFQLILMDMQMPVMDGCTAARTIRAMAREDSGRIPIIAVTANAFSEDMADTAKAGMNAHISKPIEFDVLHKTLLTYLDEKAMK